MDNQAIARKALLFARCGMGIAVLAVLLATAAAMHQLMFLWAVNGVIFVAAGTCALTNYRIARKAIGEKSVRL